MSYQSTRTEEGQFVTYAGTLAQVMDDLQTDHVPLDRCKFFWDASANKVNCVTDFQQA